MVLARLVLHRYSLSAALVARLLYGLSAINVVIMFAMFEAGPRTAVVLEKAKVGWCSLSPARGMTRFGSGVLKTCASNNMDYETWLIAPETYVIPSKHRSSTLF